jgi:hypothetical protein
MAEHPITPPPELVEDWIEIAKPLPQRSPDPNELAILAARWGANQELEACCEWIYHHFDRGLEWSMDLRIVRRPKPPSLKEQALLAIDTAVADDRLSSVVADTVRRALESLPD